MDDAVAGLDVGLDDFGVIDGDSTITDFDVEVFVTDRFAGHRFDISGHRFAWHDVVGKDGSELGFVFRLEEFLDGAGGQILLSPAPQSMDGVGAPGFAATRWRILLFRFTASSNTTTISFEDVSTVTADIDLLLDDVRLDAVINEAPVAVNDGGIGTPFLTVSGNSGVSPPITVLNNNSDGDNDPLTISAATSPNGAVVINGGQTLGFIPATDFSEIGRASCRERVSSPV